MSLEFQAKILRVLEYQRFERVAGSESIQVNVRVIAATNADLKQAMADGKFRADLYDRLAFEVITLPSLAQRLEDVPVLAAHFLTRFRQEVAGITVKEISAERARSARAVRLPGQRARAEEHRRARGVHGARRGADRRPTSTPRCRPRPSSRRVVGPGVRRRSAAAARRAGRRVRGVAVPRRARADAVTSRRKRPQLLGLTYDQFRQRYRKYGLGKD